MTTFATPPQVAGSVTDLVNSILSPAARFHSLSAEDTQRLDDSHRTLMTHLAAGSPVYGITHGFGALVDYAAAGAGEDQGEGLIAHLATGQGGDLAPDVCRIAGWIRLSGMLRGVSGVTPDLWNKLSEIWNAGFVPAMPRWGTVSASGDLQPLAHAAWALAGDGRAWHWPVSSTWGSTVQPEPAAKLLDRLGLNPIAWTARHALAFVNGTSVSLAATLLNHHEVGLLVRAATRLTSWLVDILGCDPQPYHPAIGSARGQVGQCTVSEWIREGLPVDHCRNSDRPIQEPYSIRAAPQVLGAVLDQLDALAPLLLREASGCTDNPVVSDGEVLHGGNFHSLPVGLVSDQLGLLLHQVAFLSERQLGLLCSSGHNGGLPPMLTPFPGRASGLAGVQISATSMVCTIRQQVSPATLSSLPTNGDNQDVVPMSLNGANAIAGVIPAAWYVLGSLALSLVQLSALTGKQPGTGETLWSSLSAVSSPLQFDRPLAGEVSVCASTLRNSFLPANTGSVQVENFAKIRTL